MAQGGDGLDLGAAEIKVVVDYSSALEGVKQFKTQFDSTLSGTGANVFQGIEQQAIAAGRKAANSFAAAFKKVKIEPVVKAGNKNELSEIQKLVQEATKPIKERAGAPLAQLFKLQPQTVGDYKELAAGLDKIRSNTNAGASEIELLNRKIEDLRLSLKLLTSTGTTTFDDLRESAQRTIPLTKKIGDAILGATPAWVSFSTKTVADVIQALDATGQKATELAQKFKGAASAAKGIVSVTKDVAGAGFNVAKRGVGDLSIVGSALAGRESSQKLLSDRLQIFRDLGTEAKTTAGAITRISEGAGLLGISANLAPSLDALSGLTGLIREVVTSSESIVDKGLSKLPFGLDVLEQVPNIGSGATRILDETVKQGSALANTLAPIGDLINDVAAQLTAIGPAGAVGFAAATAAAAALESKFKLIEKSVNAVASKIKFNLGEIKAELAKPLPLGELEDLLKAERSGLREVTPGSQEEKNALITIASLENQITDQKKAQERFTKQITMSERERLSYVRAAVDLERVAKNERGRLPALPSTQQLQRTVDSQGRVFPQRINGTIDFTNPLTVGNQYTPEGRRFFGGNAFDSLDNQLTNAPRTDYRDILRRFLAAEDGFFDKRIEFFSKEEKRFSDIDTARRNDRNLKASKRSRSRLNAFAALSGGDYAYEQFLKQSGADIASQLGRIQDDFDTATNFRTALDDRRRSREQEEADRRRRLRRKRSRERINRVIQARKRNADRRSGALQGGLIGGGFPLLFGQGALPAIGGGIGGVVGGLLGGPGGSFAGSIVGTAIFTALDGLANSANTAAAALEKPVESLNKLVEGKLITSSTANLASTVQGQGQLALARLIIDQGLRETGADELVNPRKAQEVKDREFVDTQNQIAIQKQFGGFDLGRDIQRAVSFYTGVYDDLSTNFAIETRDESGDLLVNPRLRARETLAGAAIGKLKDAAVKAEIITEEEYNKEFIAGQLEAGNVGQNLLGTFPIRSKVTEVGQNLIDFLRGKDPDFLTNIPEFAEIFNESKESIAAQEKLLGKQKDIFGVDLDLAKVSGKDADAEIKFLEKKLGLTRKFNRANEEVIQNDAERSAANQKNLAAEEQALRRINDLKVKSLQQDLAFSNNISALSRQRVDLLAAQGKEDPSSFLQIQGVLSQFLAQRDQANLLSQVAAEDFENVEAGRRATEASETLKNGYLEANLTLKKGLEDAQRQARNIGFALNDALGNLATAQQGFAGLGNLQTISVSGGPDIFEAFRGKRDQALQLAKDLGVTLDFDVPVSGVLTERFARRQIRDFDKFIEAGRPLRDARVGVEDAQRSKDISDETVQNFKTAIASLNSEATPAMRDLATSVDNLAKKEWRIDIQVEGQPRVIREGVY
jgi:hypothetical protein